jgi:hypothetical protein
MSEDRDSIEMAGAIVMVMVGAAIASLLFSVAYAISYRW